MARKDLNVIYLQYCHPLFLASEVAEYDTFHFVLELHLYNLNSFQCYLQY